MTERIEMTPTDLEDTPTTTTERLQNAEETVTRLRSALESAENGLHAANDVVEKTAEVRRRPVILSTIAVGASAFFLMLAKKIGFRKEPGE